jgi:hypothetical protein
MAGITNRESKGAVIMPPIMGAAIRRMTSDPVPVPIMIGNQAGDDGGHGHGLGAHPHDRAFHDGVS